MYDNKSCYIQNDNVEIKMVATLSEIKLVVRLKKTPSYFNFMAPFYYTKLPIRQLAKLSTQQEDNDIEASTLKWEFDSLTLKEEPSYIQTSPKPKQIVKLQLKSSTKEMILIVHDNERITIPLMEKHWSELKEYFSNLSKSKKGVKKSE